MPQYTKQDLVVIELDSATHKEIARYSNLREAAVEKGVSKQAIHQAIHEGTVCAGSRWCLAAYYGG